MKITSYDLEKKMVLDRLFSDTICIEYENVDTHRMYQYLHKVQTLNENVDLGELCNYFNNNTKIIIKTKLITNNTNTHIYQITMNYLKKLWDTNFEINSNIAYINTTYKNKSFIFKCVDKDNKNKIYVFSENDTENEFDVTNLDEVQITYLATAIGSVGSALGHYGILPKIMKKLINALNSAK